MMFEGNILMEGTADILAENEDAKKLYLGEQFKLDRYKND